ncbi:hypothetical protein GGR21_001531 [Dysgonomonas hofstadii]|uniref:DUF4988 domain-containing protein n=1 Tax=Dysgonomonas hofstadii TaxID=637886 RepID=A0A840CNJ0_9BACT|nr:DUF5074 domain-containing protein [Dysgonomonas hofstadii]MBB4035638.1 hypothetical protein [Dysgonomonas hofstadii]
MKRTINYLFILMSCIVVFSCSDDYDDSYLRGEIDKIKTDIESLKKQVSSIETIVEALNQGKVITGVETLSDNKGYKITFNDATSIEVLNGEEAPVIGVKESDGIYYWTITTDGQTDFLTDKDGNKLPVSGKDGESGSSPKVTIDSEGYWTIDGTRVKDANGDLVKAQGDSFFKEIEEDEDTVTFIFADDTSIVIPKSQGTFLSFEVTSAVFNAGQAQRLRIKFANIQSMEVVSKPEGWTTNIHIPDKYVNVVAAQDGYGMGEIKLQGIDKNGLTYLAIVKVSIAGKGYSAIDGVFILNEGNMTTENGSLIYISPEGQLYDRVYNSSNGTDLGNVTQDLFIHNGKMYIISQNGRKNPVGTGFENDGMLVVANSETLKKEASYNDELSSLNWPTHIAVLDEENIFIRDNYGVHLFNSTTKEVTLITGTTGAKKNRMAVANNKVFASIGTKLVVLEKGMKDVAQTIDMGATISGVIKSKDGNIWVSTTGTPNKISKVSSSSYSVIKTNEIAVGKVGAGAGATPGITAKGDTLYYSNASTTIYRHIFSTGESKEMVNAKTLVSNANIVYNNIAVHPRTGKVYLNTIKAYGWDFLINNISVFDLEGTEPALSNNYQNYTHFPAGIFFPADFQ